MMNQQYNTPQPQGDILSCGGPAPVPTEGKQANPNIWKPTGITPTSPGYNALVRQLPRNLAALQQKIYPSVKVCTHFLKDPDTGVKRTVLCRESIPGEKCPICKKIGGIYKKMLKDNGGTEAAKKLTVDYCRNLWASEHWYSNALIRQDAQNPDLNGKVKIWEHTYFVEKMLDAPCRVNPNAPMQPQVQQNDVFAKQRANTQKKLEFFIPYDPRHGRDFYLMPFWNDETKRVDYSACSFDEHESPLAPTDQEMLAILTEQCHDLNQLYADMPDEATAESVWIDFWTEVNDTKRTMGQPAYAGANPSQMGYSPAADGFNFGAQAPFQMPGAAPANVVNGAEYFANSVPQQNNDPLSVGGGAPSAAAMNDPLSVGGVQAPVANDPLSVGGTGFGGAMPQQNFMPQAQPAQFAAPQTMPRQPAQPQFGQQPAANPSQPVNDMVSFGAPAPQQFPPQAPQQMQQQTASALAAYAASTPAPAANTQSFGASLQNTPAQTPVANAQSFGATLQQPQRPVGGQQFSQPAAAPLNQELPAAEDDIDLPF